MDPNGGKKEDTTYSVLVAICDGDQEFLDRLVGYTDAESDAGKLQLLRYRAIQSMQAKRRRRSTKQE